MLVAVVALKDSRIPIAARYQMSVALKIIDFSSDFLFSDDFNILQIDQLLSLLVEESALAEKLGHQFPLTIVFVERKVTVSEYFVIYILSLFSI